jgi:lactoylglutathione lyase
MRMKRQVAVEAQEQVLAMGVDGAHGAAGQSLRPAIALVPALRGADLLRHASLEHRAHAPGGVMDGVSFGHNLIEAQTRRKGRLMPLESVQVISVTVRDRDAALDFYVNKLGLEKRMDETFGDGQRFLTVGARGDETMIALQQGEADEVGGMTGYVFGASYVEGTAAELEERGVRFTDEPTQQEWGGVPAPTAEGDG